LIAPYSSLGLMIGRWQYPPAAYLHGGDLFIAAARQVYISQIPNRHLSRHAPIREKVFRWGIPEKTIAIPWRPIVPFVL
jgi:hypothetical protein